MIIDFLKYFKYTLRNKENQMKNFLKSFLLIVAGMILGGTLLIVSLIAVSLSFSPKSVVVKKNSWLVINFSGNVKEKPVSEFKNLFNFSQKELQLIKMLKAIEFAGFDGRIEGILINADLTFYPKAYVEEIDSAIRKFRKSGKKVYAWFSTGENSNYNLALSADKIYMPKTNAANLTLTGYNVTIPYLKEGLDKLGVEFNVLHIGNFKGTGENLINKNISQELRSSYANFYNCVYEDFIKYVSQKRDIPEEKLANLFSVGKTIFMTPLEAKESGFIDEIANYEELTKEISFNNFSGVSIFDYASMLQNKTSTSKVAILYADGSIYNYYNASDRIEGEIVGAKSFIKDVEKIKSDASIKAVIVRVNSPGGSALASELILQSILELKKVKPVYVSMGTVAASGGYYISLGGDRVFAEKSTLTGSIGVVSITMNYKKFTDNLGINFETIKKNKYDDIFSPVRSSTEEENKLMIKSMRDIYEEFTGHLVKERKIDSKAVSSIAEGRIWTGIQAKSIGLVDEIGGLSDVLEFAITENKIKDYEILSFPSPPDFFDELQSGIETKFSQNVFFDKNIKKIANLYHFVVNDKNKRALIIPFYDIP